MLLDFLGNKLSLCRLKPFLLFVRFNIPPRHIVDELGRNLGESFPGQVGLGDHELLLTDELLEVDEVNDVPAADCSMSL